MRRLLLGLTALSLVVGIGACGGDDDDDGDVASATTTADFCDLVTTLQDAPEDIDASQRFYEDADLDAFVDAAPADLKDDAETVRTRLEQFAEDGDFEALLADADYAAAATRTADACAPAASDDGEEGMDAGVVDGYCTVKAELDGDDVVDDARLDDLLATTPDEIRDEVEQYVEARRNGDMFGSSILDDFADANCGGDEVPTATQAFCTDFGNANGGDTPIEEVQDSLDRAVAAQAEADSQEVTDAFQLTVDFTQAVIDGDDGDGVITDAEAQAAVEAHPTIEDALTVLTDYCAAPSRAGTSSSG